MQLYAFDSEKNLVFAQQAVKQHDYFCLECHQVVRRRGGTHRHTHFYHLASVRGCRLNEKSMAHVQVQLHILSMLPEGEGCLERSFSSINRIADVVWEKHKVIFEIQCSPITAEEVRLRNSDYNKIGYQVVWILHDKRYNQMCLSAAENYLREKLCYFTNINDEGTGILYDQFEVIEKGIRKKRFDPLPIHVEHMFRLQVKEQLLHVQLPKMIQKRLSYPFYFRGDLVDLSLSAPSSAQSDFFQPMLEMEYSFAIQEDPIEHPIRRFLYHTLIRPYCLLFQMLIERSCK